MGTFDKWNEFANKNCLVIIHHKIFDAHQYDCDALQVINDEDRIGVVIKGKELFMYKQDVAYSWEHANTYTVQDDMMTITIVNKM